MDIDAARKAKMAVDPCRRCGEVGHWAKECRLHYDIRYMDPAELETALEDKLAAKDVVVEAVDETIDTAQDFVPRDE